MSDPSAERARRVTRATKDDGEGRELVLALLAESETRVGVEAKPSKAKPNCG